MNKHMLYVVSFCSLSFCSAMNACGKSFFFTEQRTTSPVPQQGTESLYGNNFPGKNFLTTGPKETTQREQLLQMLQKKVLQTKATLP
jgi:hypothetical protein